MQRTTQLSRGSKKRETLPKAALFLVQIDFEGLPQIVEEEAKTVRRIYALFIGGMTAHGIAKQLIKEKIPTFDGKKTWQVNTVESILTNEKYKGDALLHKIFAVDFISKKIMRVNGI